jgi:hypothetical protein
MRPPPLPPRDHEKNSLTQSLPAAYPRIMRPLQHLLGSTLQRRIAWVRDALAGSDAGDVLRRRWLVAMHNAALIELGGAALARVPSVPQVALAALPRRVGRGLSWT